MTTISSNGERTEYSGFSAMTQGRAKDASHIAMTWQDGECTGLYSITGQDGVSQLVAMLSADGSTVRQDDEPGQHCVTMLYVS